MVTPRIDTHQTMRSFDVLVGQDVPVFDYLDWQGNRVHHFSITLPHDRLVIWTNSTVEIFRPLWQLEALDDAIPSPMLDHRHHDFLTPHGPAQFDERLATFARQAGLLGERRACAVLSNAMHCPAELMTITEEYGTQAPATVPEVLTRGHGNAQDAAHVAVAFLRQIRMPARYVSGYWCGWGAAKPRTHAWVEGFVPSVGWVGIDPSERQLVGEAHVALSVGRSQLDVPYHSRVHRGAPEEQIRNQLSIQRSHQLTQLGQPLHPRNVDSRLPVNLLLADRSVHAHLLD